MSGVSSAQYVAEIGVGQADMRGVVQEQCGAAGLYKVSHGLTLSRLNPELRTGTHLRQGRIEDKLGRPVATQAALVFSSPPYPSGQIIPSRKTMRSLYPSNVSALSKDVSSVKSTVTPSCFAIVRIRPVRI
jgi:hypothetical protein